MSLELPQSRFADAGGPVHYREWEGPGDLTFVCVHGLGGSHVNWASVAPGLARHGRVLALDLPGFGRSPRAGRHCTLPGLRRALSAFIRTSTSGPVVLAGNSMGGTLSILQAANEPSTVKSLILSSPVVPIARGGFPSPAVVAAFALYRIPGLGELFGRLRIKGLPPEREVELGFRMTAADPSRIGPEVVAAHVEMTRVRHRNPDAVPAFLEAARSLLFLVARPRLARELMDRVSCPVLMIQGSQDKLVPAAFGRATAGAHPAWDFRLVKDAGHVVQIELPERWLAEVEPWVTAVEAPRPAAPA